MSKVSPQSAETSRGARALDLTVALGGPVKVLDVAVGHDGCKLGMHSGFPSIDSNVHLRMD
jgi:hypothetical protein